LTVDAESTAIGHAIGEGRAYGGVRMGVNNVTATTTATNDSLLQNGISVSARNVSVIAHSSHVADASGQANAGGSLIGVTSATSTATDTTMTLAQILKTQPVTASGNVSVSAINDKSDAIAIARGINAVGLAVGVSTASANATPQVLAGVTDASITAGGDVSITAKFGSTGMPGSSVEAYGSNGISPVGTTLTATTTATETVRVIATLGNFDSPSRVTIGQITAGKNATISVDSTTRAVRPQTTRDGFFFATGDAKATAKTQHSASVCIGSGGKIKAAKALSITSAVSDAMDYLSAGENGSTAVLGNSWAIGDMQRSPSTSVGTGVTLDTDTISLTATVRKTTANGNAAWESKGLGGNALPNVSFSMNGGGAAVFVSGDNPHRA
jgi:hypothetical protein